MGWRIAEEVQEHAPQSLTWREMYVACVLANAASESTRVCRPGLLTDERLMRRMRMTDKREILRVVEKLIDAKVIERVTRGQKGTQAEFRFLPLALAQGGGFTHPDDASGSVQGGETTHPDEGSGWGVSPLRVGDSPAQGGGNTHPSQGSNGDQSSLLPSQRVLRSAGLGLSDDEEKRFIDWTKNTYKPRSSGWWRKVATEGDLPGLVAEWRASLTPASANHLDGLPPWCGECGDGGTAARFNIKLRTLDGLGGSALCPRCHPAALDPSRRTTATGRAFAQADAAGEEAKRIIAANTRPGGHQPHRNPTDQSVYLKGIA